MLASIVFLCLCLSNLCPDYSTPNPNLKRLAHPRVTYIRNLSTLDCTFFIKSVLIGLVMLEILLCMLLYTVKSVMYVTYDTNLNLPKKSSMPHLESQIYPIYMIFVLLISDNFENFSIFLILIVGEQPFYFSFRYIYTPIRYIIYLTVPVAFVYQICFLPVILPLATIIEFMTHSFTLFQQTPPLWVIFLKILLSPDIEKNPGDLNNSFFQLLIGISIH